VTKLIRTNSTNPDLPNLIQLLDQFILGFDEENNDFFAQFNKLDHIKHVIIAYDDNKAIGCGAIKQYQEGIVEIKRMFVRTEHQGKGFASKIIQELETWATELNYHTAVLETMTNNQPAISLYKKLGYQRIENYGQYEGLDSSICLSKKL
jgi:putative acetyltransferase